MAGWVRLTCQLLILRLTTRGAARFRRAGLMRRISRWRKACQRWWAQCGSSGGKVALVGDGLAGDPDCCDEADAVGVVAGVPGRVGH